MTVMSVRKTSVWAKNQARDLTHNNEHGELTMAVWPIREKLIYFHNQIQINMLKILLTVSYKRK
jgi:hypothetical protein